MSVIMQGMVLWWTGGAGANWQDHFNFTVFTIIVVLALGGLMASMILRHFSSITKSFATSVEILLTAIGAYIVIGTEITWMFFLAFVIVSIAIYLYNKPAPEQNPTAVDRTAGGVYTVPRDAEEMATLVDNMESGRIAATSNGINGDDVDGVGTGSVGVGVGVGGGGAASLPHDSVIGDDASIAAAGGTPRKSFGRD